MDETMIALGRRAVACEGWRWMPGMRWVLADAPMGPRGRYRCGTLLDSEAIPDLSDPATLGCLLALVREVWDDPGVYAETIETERDDLRFGWQVLGWSTGHSYYMPEGGYLSEAEALVAALEAAPSQQAQEIRRLKGEG